MTDADAQSRENEVDNALKRAMPEGFAAMMRNRIANAGQPGIAPAPQPKQEPPDLSVALIGPDAMKRPEVREDAMAALAALAYAAAVTGYQNGLAAKTPALADAYLSQAARQAVTMKMLAEALSTVSKPTATVSLRSSRETWNEYHKQLHRRRRALAKAEPSRLDA